MATQMTIKSTIQLGNISLDMAEAYKHLHPVGTAIAVGPDFNQISGIAPGDRLLFPFHDVMSLVNATDYAVRKTRDGRIITTSWTHHVQAIITEEAYKEIMAGKKYINWESNAKPIGRKIFIRMDDEAKITEGGIIIPIVHKQKVQTGEIVAMGPNANEYFVEEELSVGDRVWLPPERSGGELPYQDYKKGLVVRTNPQEVVAVMREGEWVPIGGRLMVKPVIPEFKKTTFNANGSYAGAGNQHEMTAYRIVGSSIIAPGNVDLVPSLGEVVKVGGGWSEKWKIAAAEGWHGPIDAKPGDRVLLRPMYNSKGEIQYGNQHIKIGSDNMILMEANFMDAVIDDEQFFTGEMSHKTPGANIASGLDQIYG